MIITVTQESRYCAEAFFNDSDETKRVEYPSSSEEDKITINRYSYSSGVKKLVDSVNVKSATETEYGYKCVKNGQPFDCIDGEFDSKYSFWLRKK